MRSHIMAFGAARSPRFALTATAAGCLALSAPAIAQDARTAPQETSETAGQVDDVLVTARRVSERAQDVPASISVATGDQLRAAGINDIQGLTQRLPNVAMSGGVAGLFQGQVGIRGISTLVRNIGVESGVGFYVDGVYLGRPEAYNQELIDIERVEVLRGPQGTLFGKNTIAGVFNITTKSPGSSMEGEGRVELGNYELARAQAYVMGPISAKLGFKVAAGYVTRDGVYRHLSGGQNGDALDMVSYRAGLYYTPGSTTRVVLAFDGLNDRGNPAFFQVTDLLGGTSPHAVTQANTPLTIDNNRPNRLRRDNYGASLTVEQDLGVGTLTSIAAWRRSKIDGSIDDDQNQVDYMAADLFKDKTDIFSEELRLSGRVTTNGHYTLGAYYFHQSTNTDRTLRIGPDLGISGFPGLTTLGSVTSKGFALFGTFDYDFSDRLSGSLGLRYTKEDKSAAFDQGDPTGIFALLGLPSIHYTGDASNDNISPTASLSFKVTSTTLVYARVARGFKSAAFNVDLVGSTRGLAAAPENATSGEIGIKSDLFQRRVRINAAVFTTRYNDLQVSQLLGSGVTLSNAGKAKISGAEAEFTAFVTKTLRFDLSGGYTDATYTRFNNCSIPTSLGGGSTDCSGNRLIGAPEFTFHGSVEKTWPVAIGDLVARVDYGGQSSVYYEATNSSRFKSDARQVLDTRFGITTARWDAFAWVKNVTDQRYITYSDDRSAIGARRTTAYGEPRTYGVTLTGRL